MGSTLIRLIKKNSKAKIIIKIKKITIKVKVKGKKVNIINNK